MSHTREKVYILYHTQLGDWTKTLHWAEKSITYKLVLFKCLQYISCELKKFHSKILFQQLQSGAVFTMGHVDWYDNLWLHGWGMLHKGSHRKEIPRRVKRLNTKQCSSLAVHSPRCDLSLVRLRLGVKSWKTMVWTKDTQCRNDIRRNRKIRKYKAVKTSKILNPKDYWLVSALGGNEAVVNWM